MKTIFGAGEPAPEIHLRCTPNRTNRAVHSLEHGFTMDEPDKLVLRFRSRPTADAANRVSGACLDAVAGETRNGLANLL